MPEKQQVLNVGTITCILFERTPISLRTSRRIDLNWPLSKTRKEKCKDGTYRTVYKNPDHAFPLYAKDLVLKIHDEMNVLKQIQINAGVDIQQLISGLLFQIDEVNRSMQFHFRAIYLGYICNPCELDKWFAKRVDKIIRTETRMRETMNRLRLSLAQKQDTRVALSTALNELTTDENTSSSEELEKALKESEEWKKKP
jgi:hypothetical protein